MEANVTVEVAWTAGTSAIAITRCDGGMTSATAGATLHDAAATMMVTTTLATLTAPGNRSGGRRNTQSAHFHAVSPASHTTDVPATTIRYPVAGSTLPPCQNRHATSMGPFWRVSDGTESLVGQPPM